MLLAATPPKPHVITVQDREAGLSVAFMKAVAAHAGHIFQESAAVEYGVDGAVKAVVNDRGRRRQSGHSIDIQLKASVNWEMTEEYVKYDLEAKTYNDLVFRFNQRRATPMVLVVLCLPKDETEWLKVSCDELVLRHCCYWCQLSGPATTNASTARIEIPRGNIMSPAALSALLRKVETGVLLQ